MTKPMTESERRWVKALGKLLIALVGYLAVIGPAYWLAASHAVSAASAVRFVLFFTALALIVALFFLFKPSNSQFGQLQ